MNRREFLKTASSSVAGISLGLTSPIFLSNEFEEWNADKPLIHTGKTLVVQPVLLYEIYEKKPQTSWRPWGGLHNESDITGEVNRIAKELDSLNDKIDFPIKILPVVKVKSNEEAIKVRDTTNYDVMIIYAASGGGNTFEALTSQSKYNLIFLRQTSGPIYLWYEIVHCRFLRKSGKNFELDSYKNPAGIDINDVVIDNYQDLLWRLRAMYGLKNFIGSRIVALGGAGGWGCPQAPQLAKDKYGIEIINVEYKELEERINYYKKSNNLIPKIDEFTRKYISTPNTELITDKKFVVNAFLLYSIFRELMKEYDSQAFTIKECMSTVMPISETTACLPLSLINDDGLLAFCESDFNVIPSGILLHYISGKPVFLNDPTYPHNGIVTVAHCTAPRRMDGKNYSPTKLLTHFESDYGVAPKVDLKKGEILTMICPDCSQKEWVGFKGTIVGSPFYDICRSQYDIEINGDWEKLLKDMRGFHWMMALGDYTKEMEYALRKIGLNWIDVSKI
jgi:hypothetical protein